LKISQSHNDSRVGIVLYLSNPHLLAFECHGKLAESERVYVTPNCPDLNPLDYHIWGDILEKYHKLQPKPKTIDELKVALQTTWEELPQEHINFIKCLTTYIAVARWCNG